MTHSKRPSVLVAGAGISGLSACFMLLRERPDLDLCVVESRTRPGGNIQTLRQDGYVIDAGPDSFLRTKPDAARLCREVGLGDDLISPSSEGRRVLIAHRGQLLPMPAGMALAVPTRLGPMLRTPLLSLPGKARILGDLFVSKPSQESRDETVASFLNRHFGQEATEQLAGPLLGGIFAGDIEELSILSTFPQLVELENRHGSLIRALFSTERARAVKANNSHKERLGAAADDPFYPPDLIAFVKWLYRQGRHPDSPFQSLRGGMGQLVDKLVERLPESSLLLGVSVVRLERLADGRWRAHLSDGMARDYDAVILCLPAHAAAAIIPDSVLAGELSAVPYVSTATVFFAVATAQLPRPLDASGYIVPRKEGRALASTWVSTKWEGRAPINGSLIRVFLGGAREPELIAHSSDAELAGLAREELERMIGPIGKPQCVWTFKHLRTNPQPVVGHNARLARIESLLADVPGLAFSSSAFGGVGIPDCIRRAQAAASNILSQLR